MKTAFGAISMIFVLLLGATVAQAAKQRYAAPTPTGSGIACTQAAPCELKEAVGKAGAGDEVIVGPGSYPLEIELSVPANVYVHGDVSQPPPKISATLAGAAVNASSIGSHLEYLEVINTNGAASGIRCTAGSLVERVHASVVGPSSVAILQSGDCMVRDSVLRADGMNSAAITGSESIGAGAGFVRNLTAIATGSKSVGVRAAGGLLFNSSYTIDAKNIIASGEEADIAASDSFNGSGKVVVSNSNFDLATSTPSSKVVDEGGNQTAAPIFVDAAAGDYREAAGSPTIDAGSTDRIGALDLGGHTRKLGVAPDIGAFEFVPPTPPPSPAGVLQSLALTPKTFKAAKTGGAAVSKVKKAKAPVGTTVSYSLTGAAAVGFTVERRLIMRKVGKCPRRAAVSKVRKGCVRRVIRYKKVKGSFSHTGAVGVNTFKFSGRLDKALAPGNYRLTGSAGGVTKSAPFKIVR